MKIKKRTKLMQEKKDEIVVENVIYELIACISIPILVSLIFLLNR